MDSVTTTEAALLSKLQSSSDLTDLHHAFTLHLEPFSIHLKRTTIKKSSKFNSIDVQRAVRSLAKQFLPFLNKSLSLIPKRLSESPKIAHHSALELFDAYRLCLTCLELIAPELASKSYPVQVQRLRYIHCLEHWELYEDAETESFSVLENLQRIVKGDSKGKLRKSKTLLVPEINESVDKEFTALVLETVVTLVKCASKSQSKEDADYWRVIALAKESQPLFKVLEAKDSEKFHRSLVLYLHRIAVFLVGELTFFEVDLIIKFCLTTFEAYKQSSVQDDMYKFAGKICSYLFLQQNDLCSPNVIDILKCVLNFMATECKVGMEKTKLEFLELVYYCVNKCRATTLNICEAIAEFFNELGGHFCEAFSSINLILRLHATGLLMSPLICQSNGKKVANSSNIKERSALQFLRNKGDMLQQLSDLLDLAKGQFNIGGKESSFYERVSYLSSYYDALKFLCQPIAECIHSERTEIFAETEGASYWTNLGSIQDAFQQLCYIFLTYQRCSQTESKIDTSDDDSRLIFSVVVASLVLSFKNGYNTKESVSLVEHVISINWFPAKRLKCLCVSLHNVAVILNRNKRPKEAVKTLKLCCKASWKCTVNLCKTLMDKSNKFHDDVAEDTIADFVKEASAETAFLLDLLNQGSNCKMNKIIRECLESWSVAENLVETLPAPVSVVKCWIKRECKLSKDVEVENVAMLYSLASSSMEMSKRTLEKLLEQELLMYKEMRSLNPRLCHKMRLKIMDALLEEVYVTKDKCLEKSRILIEKGRELRADGIAQLHESVQCLSGAISTLKAIYEKNKSCSSQVHYLLACAYIIRALCTQEAEPNLEAFLHKSNFLQDIQAVVELCSNRNHGHAYEQCSMMCEDVQNLFYITIDLLSIKGYLEIHPCMYDVVIQLFNLKNTTLEKMLAELWKNRRLSHALCASPINDVFIRTFFKRCGQFYNSGDFWRTCAVELKPLLAGFDHTDDDIKKAASDLISNVPQCSGSTFLSSHLYYDLSERLILKGKLIEALSYAKEAHRLRSKLLHEKFKYSAENQTEIFDENGEIVEKSYYCIQTFQIRYLVTNNGWLGDGISCDYEGCILTPWNVLSCYLESVLQVGIVQEILGDGSEAEMLFGWGKSISQFQGLPLFEISFSSMLGKLYRKQQFWALAEKELLSAKKILDDNRSVISCMKCVYALEVTINLQLGDLFLRRSCSNGEEPFTKDFHAKGLYRLALEKLNLSEWRNSVFDPENARDEQVTCRESSFSDCASDLVVAKDSSSRNDEPKIKFESKRSRKTKNLKRDTQTQGNIVGQNRRMTRSTYRSLGKSCEITPGDIKIGAATYLNSEHLSISTVACHQDAPDLETECYATDFECDINCLCNKMRCWHCLHLEAINSGSLNSYVSMRWELVHRKLSLRLLISLGKYVGLCGDIHDAHKLFLLSISVLFRKTPSCSKYSSPSLTLLIDSIGTDFPGDVLAVERAALIYYICWFTLKIYPYPDTRKVCYENSCIGTSKIVSLLKLAFLLCREAPLLFQKISRLLAVLYVLSTSMEPFSLSPREAGRENQWASFFHQASIGNHLNQQLYGVMQKQQKHDTDLDSSLPKLPTVADILNSLRLVPESHENLEEFVARFFQDLPCAPVICISLISGADARLLRELSCCPSAVEVWILLSHLNSENQHVILLPVNSILEGVSDDDVDSSSCASFKGKDFVKSWKCPWVTTVVDYIAPRFRQILEGNYYSSSGHFQEDTKESRLLWWKKRNRLDKCLCKFVQDVEDHWLGVWKYVLSGEWPNLKHLDSIEEGLCEEEKRVLRIISSKNCYLDIRSEASKVSVDIDSLMQLVFEKIHATPDDVDKVECVKRSPVILVLDFEVQMLPWENLPILRNQEVYRMPSVGSIVATLNRYCQDQAIAFPLIDPVDLYYLLNPDGDLNHTQVEFENWFQDQNFEGKSATVPPINELTVALKNHDLFVYMGHGSGMQYMPGSKIQELDSCAATLLMGCSSGSLSLKGCYAPRGAPISYLLAGSPVIVANLWEVTDKDIDRFGKAVLNAWLRERKEAPPDCAQCNVHVKKYESIDRCTHRPRIGSFMGQARDACTLPFLIGASPVCYGVPTGIMRKKNV
ncbi:separase isoform X1 [Olea europaea subsp. europaea]|uniref:separase n=1 Tax=Olea europaea subsp. europaea TaxID=158383 RepID=A0A8S0PAM6_OLEEU|nr:separase isoform X1 [Olea europaea subsp. europaea]